MFHHPSINNSHSEFDRLLHDLNLTPHQYNAIMEHVCYLLGSMDELFARIDSVFEENESMCKLVTSNQSLNEREKMIVATHLTRMLALMQACLNQEFSTPIKIPFSYHHKNRESYQHRKETNNAMFDAAKVLMLEVIQHKYPKLSKPNPNANRMN